jgi:pseudouridine-5'-phosphate glycosidase
LIIHPDVAYALRHHQPVVALESAVITHGLPHPQNFQLAQSLEQVVRSQSATPATIALLDGKVHIGLGQDELSRLAEMSNSRKISRRDFGIAVAKRESGGTTVAGTLIAAHLAGIQVFATGGIGGVHRNNPFDISADLPELGRTPLVVVCAGAKSILDLPATLEYLETSGVPVIGYQTDEFPAFFSTTSGMKTTARAENPAEVAEIARSQWAMGLKNAVLVTLPPPAESALPHEMIEAVIQKAVTEAEQQHIVGAALTPFLLQKVNLLSQGKSLDANLALLRNNASLAAQIAVSLQQSRSPAI